MWPLRGSDICLLVSSVIDRNMKIDGALLQLLEGRRGFDDKTLAIARQLLVEGNAAKVVAYSNGVSTQRVYAIKKQILEALSSALGDAPSLLSLDEPSEALADMQDAARRAELCFEVFSGRTVDAVATAHGIEPGDLEAWCSHLRNHAWSLLLVRA